MCLQPQWCSACTRACGTARYEGLIGESNLWKHWVKVELGENVFYLNTNWLISNTGSDFWSSTSHRFLTELRSGVWRHLKPIDSPQIIPEAFFPWNAKHGQQQCLGRWYISTVCVVFCSQKATSAGSLRKGRRYQLLHCFLTKLLGFIIKC